MSPSIKNDYNRVGTVIEAGKVVTSSAIPLTTTVLDIFKITGNGGVIEDVVITGLDTTGLAGGTAVFLIAGDGTAAGSTTFFSTAVSGLNGLKTMDLSSASVTKSRCAFPAGVTHISISSTVGACTGAGQVLVTIRVRGLDGTLQVQAL